MDSTINANSDTKYIIHENSKYTNFSADRHALTYFGHRHDSSTVQEAAQRMPPVDVMCIRLMYTLPVLLQDFVRKQENDKHQRNHQKRAQYYVFDHD